MCAGILPFQRCEVNTSLESSVVKMSTAITILTRSTFRGEVSQVYKKKPLCFSCSFSKRDILLLANSTFCLAISVNPVQKRAFGITKQLAICSTTACTCNPGLGLGPGLEPEFGLELRNSGCKLKSQKFSSLLSNRFCSILALPWLECGPQACSHILIR